MSLIRIHKTTTLPGVLEGHAVYLVAPPGNPNLVEVFVTNAAGSAARRVLNEADVQAMISAGIAASNTGVRVVDDIAARNALTPTQGQHVLVLNATGDPTVAAGAASYVWRGAPVSQWVKLTEHESMDVALTWANVSGRPTATPAAIDAAVANSHTHANLTQLNFVGEDAGQNFTYRGHAPRARLETAGW